MSTYGYGYSESDFVSCTIDSIDKTFTKTEVNDRRNVEAEK